jgi:hypothetical protein
VFDESSHVRITACSLSSVSCSAPQSGKLGLGHLPGDIVIEREQFRLYLPLVTSLLISVVLSLVL